ncbi:hypothetical protein BDF21DRAFT_323628, partial [Thamnidium elegans]
LSLQETNTSDSTIPSINIQLQPLHNFWTKYCGIIPFSSNHSLTLVDTDTLYTSDRFLICKVSRPHSFYEPYFILNLYAPASSNVERRTFFGFLYSMFSRLHATETIALHRLIISDNFNYDYDRDIIRSNRSFKTSVDWVTHLLESFYNCM